MRGIPGLELRQARAGERVEGTRPGGLAQEAQSLGGQVVVGGRQGGVPGLGDDPFAGRPAAAANVGPCGFAFGDGSLVGESFEVTAHSRRGEPEQLPQRGCGDRTALRHGGQDAGAGARLLIGMPFGRRDNHNASMS